MLHIKLCHRVSSSLAGVGHIYANGDGSLLIEVIGAGPYIGVAEGCVTESVAEGIEWLAFEVHIGSAVADVVVHHGRFLIERGGPGGYEMASGIVGSEEDLPQCCSFVLRSVRHVQDGRQVGLR